MDLSRFIVVQEQTFETALAELTAGKKETHWMWFIFPQVQGLGLSQTSRFYGIQSLAEAKAYLEHPILGSHLITITESLLMHMEKRVSIIMGSPDDLKLRSCMTLFHRASPHNALFRTILDHVFEGHEDERTLEILEKWDVEKRNNYSQ